MWSPTHYPFFSGGTPILNSIRLSGLCHRCTPPLATLTSINLLATLPDTLCPSWRELHDMLTSASSLTNLTLCGLDPLFPQGADVPDIEIPSLRCLALNFRFGENTNFIRFFTILNVPQLEFLELDFMSCDDLNELVDTYLRYRVPQFPKLHTIKFFRCDQFQGLQNDSLDHFFNFTSEITDVYLHDTEGHFLLETRRAGQRGPGGVRLGAGHLVWSISSPPWSSLTAITYRPTSKEQMMCLTNIIQSRIAGGHPLSKVRVPRGCLLLYAKEASILQQLVPVVEQLQYTSEHAYYGVGFELVESSDAYYDEELFDFDDDESCGSSYVDSDEVDLDLQLAWDHFEPAAHFDFDSDQQARRRWRRIVY